MLVTVDLHTLVSRISLGKMSPSMRVYMTEGADAHGTYPSICIAMDIVDAQSDDATPMPLYQCYRAPTFETEQAAVHWIYDRVAEVLLHELAEFFRFDGKLVGVPEHPLVLRSTPHEGPRNE